MRKIKWSWLGIIATLFCLSGGGALAFFLTATPLRVGSWQNKGFKKIYTTHREIASVTTFPLDQTQIIAQQGNPDAANAVKSALGIGQVQVAATGDIGSEVTVVVGNDLAVLAK